MSLLFCWDNIVDGVARLLSCTEFFSHHPRIDAAFFRLVAAFIGNLVPSAFSMKWEEKALRTRLEGKRLLLYILLFGAYFWPQCMIMYPSLQKCWEHWPPKPHSRPQSPSFLGHEVLVRYKLGRVDLWTRIPKPVKARNWTGPGRKLDKIP